ncbi:MAG: alanine racemase [Clostridia bacterium]|nr:alanine racemase [Clostridia bacterium]
MPDFIKRTWAEIDLEAIENNYREIKALLKPTTQMICVVKADAYGHGVEFVAKEYDRLGADRFAVSNIEEALELRELGIKKPVLILGYTPPGLAGELAANNITQSVFSYEYAKALAENAERAGVNVCCHLKVDTGMGRIGVLCQDAGIPSVAVDIAQSICDMDNLDFEGIFTHFSVADDGEAGRDFTNRQYNCFIGMVHALEQRGIKFKLRHCCNSAATIAYPQFHLDAVRPGIILYGLEPSPKMEGAINIRPAMQLKSVLSLVKDAPAGTSVSYGRTYVADRSIRIATVPIGYADGYQRSLSGRQDMLVAGKRAPIIGRVCMDQLMLDVSDIPEARSGMTITVFGSEGKETISVNELAEKIGTINYELVCLIGKRVARVAVKDGKYVGTLSYFKRH